MMALASPSANPFSTLILSGEDPWKEDDNVEDSPLARCRSTFRQEQPSEPYISTYVRVFEEMVNAILQNESHLFDDEEISHFEVYANLSYHARFLLVRLLLRKQGVWHRLDSLKYQNDLGEAPAIMVVIDEICQNCAEFPTQGVEEEREIIDLTMDDEPRVSQTTLETHDTSAFAVFDNPEETGTLETSSCSKPKPIILAESELHMDLDSLLDCLRIDELRSIAKALQLNPNKRKQVLIATVLRTSSSQSTLVFMPQGRQTGSSVSTTYLQTKLPSGMKKIRPQQERVREMALRFLTKCIRVDATFHNLVRRANLVFFRLTQYTSELLITALLPSFKKRTYPSYEYIRSKAIWESRQALLEYESALILESQVDAMFGGQIPSENQKLAASPFPAHDVRNSIKANAESGVPTPFDEDPQLDVKLESPRSRGAHAVKEIFENIFPRWQTLLRTMTEEQRSYGLGRFESGHILTRIVCKGSHALGILKEYERELEVLEALLAQKRWRRGRRGRWHERRALILFTHLPKSRETAERALEAIIEALEDPDTHIVYRSKLQRRLVRLKNVLKVSHQDHHIFEGQLSSAKEVEFSAIRIRHRAASVGPDKTSRAVSTSPQPNHGITHYYRATTTPMSGISGKDASPVPAFIPSKEQEQRTGKTIWAGCNGEELTVEAYALQCYEGQGYKGLHCETRIIVMLFGLLFWDVIFAPIPGAFETPYQTAPLDITEDSFYHSRKDLMETRLSEIRDGKAATIIQAIDSAHRDKQTLCVGVQWDLVGREDLVDIVTCIGGESLSVICRVLCEDYAARRSGGPDLFLWDVDRRVCKFVEVKGPGDTLQENQKVWIDVLLRAGVPVEVCRVVEQGDKTDGERSSRKTRKTRRKQRKIIDGHPSQEDGSRTETPGDTDVLPTTSPAMFQVLLAEPPETSPQHPNPLKRAGGSISESAEAATRKRTRVHDE